MFKNLTPFTDLSRYSNNYWNKSRHLWQYYRDEPSYTLIDSESFKPRVKITLKTPDDGNTKGVEIAIPLKCLSNFLENSKNAFN